MATTSGVRPKLKSVAVVARTRKIFAMALYEDPAATRGDLREAMTTLEEIERTARRMLGGAHPLVTAIERNLRASQDAFYARGLP